MDMLLLFAREQKWLCILVFLQYDDLLFQLMEFNMVKLRNTIVSYFTIVAPMAFIDYCKQYMLIHKQRIKQMGIYIEINLYCICNL